MGVITVMSKNSTYYLEIIGKLEKLCRKKYLSHLFTGVQLVLFAILLILTIFSFVEIVAHLNSSLRTFLFFFALFVISGAFLYLVLIPLLQFFKLFRQESYYQVANDVGAHFPKIKDDLLNSMQLVSSEDDEKLYSTGLISAAFQKVYERTKNLQFETIINFKKAKTIFIYLNGAIILFIAMILFIPGLQAASYRLVNYSKEFVPPVKFEFDISPGNLEITKGEDVLIKVTVVGDIPNEIYIAAKNEDEAEFTKNRLISDSTGSFNINLPSVRTSFKYFATAENIYSDEFEIKIIDRPIVKTLQLEISPPAYSRQNKIVQKDNGNVTSLVGTRVKVELSSTKNLIRAFLQFADLTETELDVRMNKVSGKFTVRKDNNYVVKLFDESGNENLTPIKYQIRALRDAYPTIEMIAPNMNIPLSNDNRINLIVNIADDYGFSDLVLNYRLSASRYEPAQKNFRKLNIPLLSDNKQTTVDYIWNLTSLTLGVDDVISYYLEVFDNDNISGPKSVKTSVFTVRIPSLDEILAEANQVQSQSESGLEQILKEAEDLQKTLRDINQELKKDEKELSWEEKEKIENALEKFEELQKNIEEMKDQLQEMQNHLQRNDLLSKETLEKYNELQKLMDEMTSEELKKAMKEFQNKLQQLNRSMTQEQLENFKLDEELFKKSIERTLNLLKRIQIDQKIDELIKRTEDLTNKQNELKEQTQGSDASEQRKKDELNLKQKDISKKLDKLSKEMNNLEKKMSEFDDMPQEELGKMMEELEEQQNKELSDKTSEDIQENNMKQALQQQQQIANNMDQLNQQLQNMKNSMMMQNLMQTFTDLMKILDNMLELSKKQEELKNDTENAEQNSSSFNKNAEKQDKLKRNLSNIMSQMADLSQKTFAITPGMGKALGDANKQMQQSIKSLLNRNGSYSAITQSQAMMHLNEAASMMKSSMEAMMQGGGGQGGMMSLMQQLQQLSSQQMDLNSLTQKLQQMMQGQLSPQQQGEMNRLAQQQELIRKSLNQLNKEAKISGESNKIPADLDNILNEMREVLTNMNSNKLDDALIQKQKNILSKLLDAQRSINERDFEKERRSSSGKNIVRKSPSELNLNSEEGKDKLRDELNKAVREGYVKDFEELILKYYEAIQQVDAEKK